MGHSDQTISSEFLSPDGLSAGTRLHLILLNYILPPQTVLLWQQATTRICADGGANRLYDQIPAMLPGVDSCSARQEYLPDLIKGDLDSVRPDVQDFYTSHGVPLLDLSADQETTDLEKCLLFLEGRLRALPVATTAAHQQNMQLANTSKASGCAVHVAKGNEQTGNVRAPKGPGPTSSNKSSDITINTDSDIIATSLRPVVFQEYIDVHQTTSQQQQWRHDLVPQQQLHKEVFMFHKQQQQLQRAGLDAAAARSPSSCRPPTMEQNSSSSSSGGVAGCSKVNSSQQPIEVYANMMPSADGMPAERMYQEHVIIVLGALGGRLDHTLANLNTLYCYPHLNIILWGDGNLVRLLRAGRCVIRPSRMEGPTCGLIPLARPATASSKGLKWDLDNTHMSFRGLLSTSNIISSDVIEVTSDEDLLWITAINECMTPSSSRS